MGKAKKRKILKDMNKTFKFLRKLPVIKLIATAGLGIALFASANQGSKTYQEGDDF